MAASLHISTRMFLYSPPAILSCARLRKLPAHGYECKVHPLHELRCDCDGQRCLNRHGCTHISYYFRSQISMQLKRLPLNCHLRMATRDVLMQFLSANCSRFFLATAAAACIPPIVTNRRIESIIWHCMCLRSRAQSRSSSNDIEMLVFV